MPTGAIQSKEMFMAQLISDKEIDKIVDAFRQQVNDCADYIFMKSQEKLVEDGKVDTGHLLKTAFVQRADNRPFALVVYPAPYAEAVEYGSGPHPMYAGWLEDWVRRKLEIKDPKEVKRIAFAIAKTIEKRGIKASPYVRPAIAAAIEHFK